MQINQISRWRPNYIYVYQGLHVKSVDNGICEPTPDLDGGAQIELQVEWDRYKSWRVIT